MVDISTGGTCIVRLRHGDKIITGKMYVGNINAWVNYAEPVIGRDSTSRLRIEAPTPIVKMNINLISIGEITAERSG